MSAEDEKEIEPGETPAEPAAEKPAAKKPAARKKAAAKAEEPAAKAEEPTAKADELAAEAEEPSAEAGEPTEKPAKAKRAKVKAGKAKAAKPDAEAQELPAEEESVDEDEEPAAELTPATPAQRRAAVSARARYVRTSARKARMVCGHLRGKSVQEARAILAFTPRDAARDWSKLLESAVANAENNHELLEDDLVIHAAYADEGPTIKRFRPRAMGRATPIRKRTSHLTITLTPRS
jgi:ribosomal protein L22